jgi:hypothetical protein
MAGSPPRRTGPVRIEVEVSRIDQLFNELDPAPFHERDMDDACEEYIVESAREHSRGTPLTIVIHVREPTGADAGIEEAVHNYFDYRARAVRRALRNHLRDARVSLLIGLLFLATCMAARQILGPGTGWHETAREGILIGGWVAMWHPLNQFLYGWWPLVSRRRLYDKLAATPVELVAAAGPPRS